MTVATTATSETAHAPGGKRVPPRRTAVRGAFAPAPTGRRRGFAYVALLLVLAGLALGALRVTESARVSRQREAERQLLFVGRQYREAIARYTARGAGALSGPPKKLDDLLTDKRLPVPAHDLRRLFPDPMTGRADWEVLRDASGGIVGVRSRSRGKPLQRQGFDPEETGFAGAASYAEWTFTATPGATPGAGTATPKPNGAAGS